MKLKKGLAIVLAAISCLSMAACNKGEKSSSDGKLTITWMGISNYASGAEGSFPEKLLEEKYNIEIEPVFLDSKAYETKRPIMFASDEIPDVIYLLDPKDVKQDAENGFLMELPYEEIKKNVPGMYDYINENVPDAWLYSSYNGKNYGIPTWTPEGDNHKTGLWRKDWLENVGIDKVPETLEEMEEAFRRFVNNDPDGNGKKDTYALSGDLTSYWMTFGDVFGAYGVVPFNWMRKDDGSITHGALMPETKEVLSLLAKWKKEGLIHPDFITDRIESSQKQKFLNGEIGYINHYGTYGFDDESNPNSTISVMKSLNPNVKLAVAKPPVGPEGKSGTFAWGKGGNIICFGAHVAKTPEKYELVMKIMQDIMTDEEFSLRLRLGEQKTHWDLKDPDKGDNGGIYQISPYDDRRQSDKECFRFYLGGPSFYAMMPSNDSTIARFVTDEEKTFKKEYYSEPLGILDVFLKPDTFPSSGQYTADLIKLQTTEFAKIILGEKSIDDYDDFIAEWKKRGGEQLLKEANEQLQVKNEIFKQLGINK